MEVEEPMVGAVPQQAFVEFVDNGELDLDYGGGLLEAEQEPDTFPHSASAAYEESPPPRSRHASQPSSNNKDAAAAAKEHRPISFLEWQKKSKPSDEKEASVKDDTARSSHHQGKSPRRREPEGSRHQDTSRARSQEDRRRHNPHPREPRGSPRRKALTPERQRPASRPRVDERRVMVVPKFVDINHGIDRQPRLDRPARSGRDRTRSPHIHRATLHSRAGHPAAYDRRRDPEVSRNAQHVPTRNATEPVWPELHAPPSGRKVEDFVRPHLDRAPLRTPDFAWDAAQYERTSHTVYPDPAEYDYRHGQSDYREPVARDAGYRAPLYREAAYGESGYAAAQGREVGYRPPSYDYDEATYRDYSGSRAMDLPHSSYARPDANWDAPRFPDPRHDTYPHVYAVPDDRWNDREQRQLPARGSSPRMPRADRGSPRLARGAERDPVGLSRSGSYPYSRHDSRHDRGHDFLPAREEPGLHAPRLAREYAAPPPRSYRDGLHQGPRDTRDARPRSVSRHVEEYAPAGGQHGDLYASRRPPPPPSTSRRPSPWGRSPRRREHSPARATDRHREPARRSHHEADRPSDRARRPSDRAEPAGREALKLTSRSFAMEAAAASRPAPAPEPAEPGQLDIADLPPPPVGDASKAAPSQAAKPSRASVLVRPDPATDPRAVGGDTSPVLNVQQGFLSEDTSAPADRPFQRGQRSQHPTDASADKSRQRAAKVGGSGKGSERRSSRDRAPAVREGKDAHKASAAAEAKYDKGRSGAKDGVEPTSNRSDRRQGSDTSRIADGKTVRDEPGAAAKRVSSGNRHERQKAKPSSGGKDTPKVGSAHRSAVPQASPPAKAKDSISKDRPASEPKSDPKKAPRSPPRARARANPTADQGNKAGSKAGSKGDAVGEKQAGRKRRSRSRERSRSPKRKASSPAARKSSKDSDGHEGTSGRKEQPLPLPPPPARPSSAAKDGDLPPPPIRLDGKAAAQQAGATAPTGADQALPPPPPKPHSRNKESSSSRADGDVNGHDQLDSKTAKPAKESKPANKPSVDAARKDASAKDASAKDASANDAFAKDASAKDASATDAPAKDASAKDASAKNASAKGAVEKGASKKDALAKDSSAMGASAKGASAKVASAKGAMAKASNKTSERDSSAGRGSHKASDKAGEKATDKGHLVARDSRRSDDRPPTGRSGQKRARSRSPQKPMEGSKTASSTKRQAKASDGKQGDAKHSALQNGTSERSKDVDKEARKEWMYEDKGKTLGPVSKKRLLETWQKFKTESKSKAADYLRFPVWRDGSRRAKQQVRDILTI